MELRQSRSAQPAHNEIILRQRRTIVAETHVSTACAPPSQEARLPQAHEESRWTESSGPTPQEGAPQSHARLIYRGWIYRGIAGWCAARNTTWCIAKGAAGRAASSRYFYAPMASKSAGLAGALKRRWVTRSGATESGAAFAKFLDCTDRRLPPDGIL